MFSQNGGAIIVTIEQLFCVTFVRLYNIHKSRSLEYVVYCVLAGSVYRRNS